MSNQIKEVLHNLSINENNNQNDLTDEKKAYYKGLLVGIVSTLIDREEITFNHAILIVKDNLPLDCIDFWEFDPWDIL